MEGYEHWLPHKKHSAAWRTRSLDVATRSTRPPIAGSLTSMIQQGAPAELILNHARQNKEQLDEHDELGSTPFLYALISKREELAKELYLMRNVLGQSYPDNRTEVGLYDGENALHIAIVQGQSTMLQLLLDESPNLEALLGQHATGLFFVQGGPCAYGGTPLAFAVATGRIDFVDKIVAAGGDLWVTYKPHDRNLLHLCVEHHKRSMYTHIHKLMATKSYRREDNQGMTPLVLAVDLGDWGMFNFLFMHYYTTVLWRYGPWVCWGYRVEELDTLTTPQGESEIGGGCRRTCVFDRMVRHQFDEFLWHPLVAHLQQQRWNYWSKWIHLRHAIIDLAILIVTSGLVLIHRSRRHSAWDIMGQVIVGCAATWKAYGQVWASIAWRRYPEDARQLGFTRIYRQVVTTWFWSTAWIAFIAQLLGQRETELVAIAALVLSIWLLQVVYLLILKWSGAFTIMIIRMVAHDLPEFMSVFSLFMVSFTLAFVLLVPHKSTSKLLRMVNLVPLDEQEMEEFIDEDAFLPAASGLVFVLWAIGSIVLLINLFIATMSKTFRNVQQQSTRLWLMERLRLSFAYQASLSPGALKKLRENSPYWLTKVGPDGEQRWAATVVPQDFARDFAEKWKEDDTDDVVMLSDGEVEDLPADSRGGLVLPAFVRSPASASGGGEGGVQSSSGNVGTERLRPDDENPRQTIVPRGGGGVEKYGLVLPPPVEFLEAEHIPVTPVTPLVTPVDDVHLPISSRAPLSSRAAFDDGSSTIYTAAGEDLSWSAASDDLPNSNRLTPRLEGEFPETPPPSYLGQVDQGHVALEFETV